MSNLYTVSDELVVLDAEAFRAVAHSPERHTETGHSAVLHGVDRKWVAAHWPTVQRDPPLKTLLVLLLNGLRPHLGPDAPIELDLPEAELARMAVPMGWVLFRHRKTDRFLVSPLTLIGIWDREEATPSGRSP